MPRFLVAFILLSLTFVSPVRADGGLEIQEVTSPGGISAWLVEDRSNPLLAMSFSFAGGSALDPAGKEGRARLAASLLDEGAGELDAAAFQGKLDRLSIDLSFSASRDRLSGSLAALTAVLPEAASLLRLALTEPRFDEDALARVKGQTISRLERLRYYPNAQAAIALQALLFPDHPYGKPSRGTPESVAALTAEDLRSYVGERVARDRLTVGVVGAISAEELGPLLDEIFGGLPAESAPFSIPDVRPADGGVLETVALPVPQASIMLAQPGPLRDDPDYYALNVVNTVLGGASFVSRLFGEVRTERGLAYSVWSSLAPLEHAGVWYAGSGTQTARVGEAVAVMRDVWQRMREEGPTPEELELAVAYLVGSFALNLTSSEDIASILVAVQEEGLGIDYLAERRGYYESLSLEEVRAAAAKWLQPEALTVVVAGEASAALAETAPAAVPASE